MQSYALTVAAQLERLGHEVTLYSPELGVMAETATERGLRVAAGLHRLPLTCDTVIAQDMSTLLQMTERYPTAFRLLVVHSAEYDIHLPPTLPGAVSHVVVLNDAAERRVRAMQLPVPVSRLRHPIDHERQCSINPLHVEPKRVLLLGNYMSPRGAADFDAVCARTGLECRQIGVSSQPVTEPVSIINDADIVIGQGRSILDAMACGRAAWVYGPSYADGWVTAGNYAALESDGFRGRALDVVLDANSFAAALADYRPEMGSENRRLVMLHHSPYEHAAALVGLIGDLRGRREPTVDAPLQELARMVRTQFTAQSGMYLLNRELNTVHSVLAAVTHERDEARAAHSRLALEDATEDREWLRGNFDAAVDALSREHAAIAEIVARLATLAAENESSHADAARETVDALRREGEARTREGEALTRERDALAEENRQLSSEVERLDTQLRQLLESRRWQVAAAALAPLDAVRAVRRKIRPS
jgi:hypothetical protein